MNKLLTVIVPTYNVEKYLDSCLSSLIVSDVSLLNELEVLIINDGSSDRSPQIAHSFSQRYPNVFIVIDKENGHYGSCINRGLSEASGKYVKILDADDKFDTDNLSEFLNFLRYTDADCILTDWGIESSRGNHIVKRFDMPKKTRVPLGSVIRNIDKVMMHNVCYLTAIFRHINYRQTEGIPYTDTEWCCLPMSASTNVIYYDAIIYRYQTGIEGQSTSDANMSKDYWLFLKVLKKIKEDRASCYPGCSEEGLCYMDALIRRYMRQIYYFHILLYHNEKINSMIISLDLQLKSENYYDYLEMNDDILILGVFHYLKRWRENYDLNSRYLILLRSFFRFSRSIYGKILPFIRMVRGC